jgi:hypothetical protein
MDDNGPPIRRLALKPKDVIPIDSASRAGDGTAISVQLIHRENQLAEEKRAGSKQGGPPDMPAGWGGLPLVEPGATARLDPPSRPGDPSAISVHEILSQNRAADAKSAPVLIAMPPRRKSRRNRDFSAVLAAAALAAGVLTLVFRKDPQIIGLAMIGVVCVSAAFAWIIYGVMDKY